MVLPAKGLEDVFWGDADVLQLDEGGGYSGAHMSTLTELYILNEFISTCTI